MRKRMRFVAVAVMICLMVLALGGCKKKVTVESILTETAKNLESVESIEGSLSMEMGFGISQSGFSMGMNMNMDFDMEVMKDPSMFHMNGNVGMDLMDFSVDMEAYGETKENQSIVYMNVGDEWTKQSSDATEEESFDILQSVKDLLPEDPGEKGIQAVLAEDTETVNGKDAYVITSQLSGEDIGDALDVFESLMEDSIDSEMDLSDLTVEVTIKVYKDSMLPASIGMTMADGAVSVADEDGMAMTLDGLSYEFIISEYNSVEKIEIPEEALNAEEETMDTLLDDTTDDTNVINENQESSLLQEDGKYILTDYSESVQVPVAPPADFTISEYSDNTWLCFDSNQSDDEVELSLTYTVTELYDGFTEEDLEAQYISMGSYTNEDEDYQDVQISDVQTVQVGEDTVKYISISYCYGDSFWSTTYYTWVLREESYAVECVIEETAFEETASIIDESVIETAFDAVQ